MARPRPDAALANLDHHRERVLSHPRAQGISVADTDAHLAEVPIERYPNVTYGLNRGRTCLQPRGGVPTFEGQLRLTQELDAAGADFIPLTIDSYSRHNEYDTASELLARSEEEETDYLNGYPLVTHGHDVTRELYRGLRKPVSLRHGTPDARLMVEVALASGIVEIEGGGICYCLPYSEGFPLDRCLQYWQYVDRVCAAHSTPERPVHRESFGPLTATMVPPAMVVAIEVLEALLAAEQGVRSFAVSFGQTGSVMQDLATATVLRRLTRDYLEECGFGGTEIFLVYHQWMGQFPLQRQRAADLIAGASMVASLVQADKMVVKTVEEAMGVPTAETNAEAVKSANYIARVFRAAEPLTSPLVDREADLIESQSRSILDAVFELPGSAFWESVYRAFQLGFLDVPFAPHADNANKLLSIRDDNGSIRITEPGKVPIREADLAAEHALLAGRGGDSGAGYKRLLADINMMM